MPTTHSPTEFTTFGEFLRHLRRRARLTQRELGLAVGYSEAHIARLESGTRLPDVVAVKGAFVEALDLKREPELTKQLVELAQLSRGKADPATDGEGAIPWRRVPSAHSQPLSNNLPTPASKLIGREKDIVAAGQLLKRGEARLITLIGPPGVGKTRLVIAVATEVQDDYVDGTWLVELAPITEPQTVLTTIARALEIEDRPGKPILRVLQDHLRDKHLLLVLDNLEQVLDAAPLIGQVLSAAPKVKVLATSREPLRIAGEQVYIVNPLADEAVELFVQRAQAVKPDFALTEANRATIAEMCRKLDGLPLAIELAAARITLFTPQEMLARLDQRLSLLTGGARDLPTRQRTLRATLDWSYGLLTPDEQALFRRLGVFAGAPTTSAIGSVCRDDAEHSDLINSLAALVSKSIVKCIVDASGLKHKYCNE